MSKSAHYDSHSTALSRYNIKPNGRATIREAAYETQPQLPNHSQNRPPDETKRSKINTSRNSWLFPLVASQRTNPVWVNLNLHTLAERNCRFQVAEYLRSRSMKTSRASKRMTLTKRLLAAYGWRQNFSEYKDGCGERNLSVMARDKVISQTGRT
jgi:hypothetical protein